MFCPNCSGYLTEKQLLKTNVKKFLDTDIEYDARCPICEEFMGKMFWGKLQPAPQFTRGQAAREAPPIQEKAPEKTSPKAEQPYAEMLEVQERPSSGDNPEHGESSSKYVQRPPFPPPSYYFCPHCGQRLPDKGELPFRTDDLL